MRQPTTTKPFTKQQAGVALLDILLSLVIVMILITATVLYWQSNQRANLTQAGYNLLQDIIEAAQGWQPTNVNQGKYSGISVNALLREGSIPAEYITDFDATSSSRFARVSNRLSSASSGKFSKVASHLPVDNDNETGLTTPWAGDSKVYVTQAGQGVLQIIFDDIPNYACDNLADRVNNASMAAHSGVALSSDASILDGRQPNIDRAKCQDNQDGNTKLIVWYHPEV